MKDQLNNRKELVEIRKLLRNNLTSAEATLWKFLSGSKLGRKFRRQQSVGNYVLDFYCPAEKLAIELDGQGHFNSAGFDYDEERTAFLNAQGIRVVRFENDEVFKATEAVIETIKNQFAK